MTGHALWKGSIAFGEVSVPVKLHSSVKEERIGFHLLHRVDGVRLHQKMICSHENLPVPHEDVVKGFEVEEGKYVIVDPEEIEAAEPIASRAIEVHEFVAAGQIDPLFYGRTYYLEADGIVEGYSELVAALGEQGLAGICTWTMRKRSYLGALQAKGKALRLCTLRYADEVLSADSLGLGEFPISDKEVRIGCDLLAQLTEPFEPLKYKNEHHQKLMELIAKKSRGEKISILSPRILAPTPPDKLLEALEASLKKAG